MKRTIRSFVLRGGRVTTRQQKGLDLWLDHYQLPAVGFWDFAEIFGREADTVLEIGFGMGASLLTMAANAPKSNFIGVEVHQAGVGALAADLHEQQIDNVKLVSADAVEVLQNNIPENSLSAVQIFFPDPWPKKKHHKRRLIQPDFIRLLVSRLKPGGIIHTATDWQDYAEQMLVVLSAEPALKNAAGDAAYSPRPMRRPETKFEKRGQRLGHGVWDLIFINEGAL